MLCSTSSRTTWRSIPPTPGGGTCCGAVIDPRRPTCSTSIGAVTTGRWSCRPSAAPWTEVLADGACVRESEVLLVDGQPFPARARRRPAQQPARLLAEQHYRPAYWRTGETEGNYRRFFDIGTLIGVRVEDPEVFARTHERILAIASIPRWPDCVSTTSTVWPTRGRIWCACATGSTGWEPPSSCSSRRSSPHDESLDPRWPVEGTTGYEFGDRVLGLFLDPEGCAGLLEFGARLARAADSSFAALVRAGQARGLRSSRFRATSTASPGCTQRRARSRDARPRPLVARPATGVGRS